MKKAIAIFGFLLLASASVWAQTTTTAKPATVAQSDRHSCIMAGDDVWTSIGLSADQKKQVQDVQASCKADYNTAKPDEKASSVARHEEKLKSILTPEQYTKWSKWCAQEAAAKPQTGTTK